MSIGMSYDEYWYGSPYLIQVYAKAEEHRQAKLNQDLWLQGLYNYKAFSSVMDAFSWGLNGCKGKKPDGYIEKPLPITKLEQEVEKQERIQHTLDFFMNGQK